MLGDNKLSIFIAFADLRSFSAVAKRLNISQSAVSQSISDLEKELKTQLVVRNRGKESSLTSAGLAFYKYAHEIDYWYKASQRLFGSQGLFTLNKAIRIYSSSSLLTENILAKAVSILLADKLNLNFELTDSLDDSVDIEFYTDKEKMSEELDFDTNYKIIASVDACLIVSEHNKELLNFANLDTKDQSLSQVLKHITDSYDLAIWKPYKDLLSLDILSRLRLSSNSIQAIQEVVSSSSNIVGLVPNYIGDKPKSETSLIKLNYFNDNLKFDLYYKYNKRISKEIISLIEETIRQLIKLS